MRYKEKEKVLFKFHSGITDANDFKVGSVVTQLEKGLPDWKNPGEFYYIIKSEFGWVYEEGNIEAIKKLVGEEVLPKLELGSNYWLVREKNIFGKWEDIAKIPDVINFQLLRHKVK